MRFLVLDRSPGLTLRHGFTDAQIRNKPFLQLVQERGAIPSAPFGASPLDPLYVLSPTPLSQSGRARRPLNPGRLSPGRRWERSSSDVSRSTTKISTRARGVPLDGADLLSPDHQSRPVNRHRERSPSNEMRASAGPSSRDAETSAFPPRRRVVGVRHAWPPHDYRGAGGLSMARRRPSSVRTRTSSVPSPARSAVAHAVDGVILAGSGLSPSAARGRPASGSIRKAPKPRLTRTRLPASVTTMTSGRLSPLRSRTAAPAALSGSAKPFWLARRSPVRRSKSAGCFQPRRRSGGG